MLDSSSNPSPAHQVSRSPGAADNDDECVAAVRLQFCRGDHDVTAQPGAEIDATEVRLWDGQLCLAAVVRDRDGWGYAGSDCGHRLSEHQLHARFGDWRQALHALTGITTPAQ